MKRVLFFNDFFTSRSIIMSNVKGFGGVYILTNNINGKRYVGSSINLRKRLYSYFETKINTLKGVSIIFNALIKYGYSNFSLTVILIPNATKESVLALEQYVIDILNPEYNILKLAGSPLGFKHTSKAKAKVSAAALARGWKGDLHPSFNTGKVLYLYSVINDELILHSIFPNLSRAYSALNISRRKI